jgi:hypothetical protein
MNTETKEEIEKDFEYYKTLSLKSISTPVFGNYNTKITLEYNYIGYCWKTNKPNTILTSERNIFISGSPTHNCQLASFATFTSVEDFDEESVHNLFKYIYPKVGKQILMLDIRQDSYQRFKEIFDVKKYTVLNKPYKSTNGSPMRIINFNLGLFVEDFGKYQEPTPKKKL